MRAGNNGGLPRPHGPLYVRLRMNGSVYKLTDRRHRPWRAVYTGPDGRRRTKSFARKAEAERWLRTEVAAIDRGAWVDPAAGKVAFREWAGSGLRTSM